MYQAVGLCSGGGRKSFRKRIISVCEHRSVSEAENQNQTVGFHQSTFQERTKPPNARGWQGLGGEEGETGSVVHPLRRCLSVRIGDRINPAHSLI